MILSFKKIIGLFILGMIIFYLNAQQKPNIIWLMAEDIGPILNVTECQQLKLQI